MVGCYLSRAAISTIRVTMMIANLWCGDGTRRRRRGITRHRCCSVRNNSGVTYTNIMILYDHILLLLLIFMLLFICSYHYPIKCKNFYIKVELKINGSQSDVYDKTRGFCVLSNGMKTKILTSEMKYLYTVS